MKNIQIFLLLIFFNYIFNLDKSEFSISSCGKPVQNNSYKSPDDPIDCKDDNEEYCKWVSILKNGTNKTFCAVIHGKYDDDSIKDEVKNLIKAEEIIILSSKFFSIKYYFIFFYILILLF